MPRTSLGTGTVGGTKGFWRGRDNIEFPASSRPDFSKVTTGRHVATFLFNYTPTHYYTWRMCTGAEPMGDNEDRN